MSSNIRRDYLHRQLPIREFAAWLLGGVVGLYIGVRVGLKIENNIGPCIGGALGWFIVGGSFWRLSKVIFRSTPKLAISVYAARLGFIGMTAGIFVSDFIAVKTNTSGLIAAVWGPVAGLIVGLAMGIKSKKRMVQKKDGRQETKTASEP